MERWIIRSCVFTIAVAVVIVTSLADDHVVAEMSRTYKGTTSPKRRNEIWIGPQAVCFKNGSMITVFRFDLGKMWKINPDSNRYFEDTLSLPDSVEETKGKEADLHKLGFDYEPEYEWSIEKTDTRDTVDGIECRKVIIHGDADYSEKSIELWITKRVPIDIARYYRSVLSYTLDAQWQSIYRKIPELKEYIILKRIEIEEPPIASTTRVDRRMTTAEVADPPTNVYDLPAGCRRVHSLDSLSR